MMTKNTDELIKEARLHYVTGQQYYDKTRQRKDIRDARGWKRERDALREVLAQIAKLAKEEGPQG